MNQEKKKRKYYRKCSICGESWEHKYNIDISQVPKIAIAGQDKVNVNQIRIETLDLLLDKLKECNSSMDSRIIPVSRIEAVQTYCNNSTTLECITFIKGNCEADGCRVMTGTTVVLEPGEMLEGNIELAIMARPK